MGASDFLRRLLRASVASPGRWPRAVLALGFGVILAMFCTHSDMAGDPRGVRGDGMYRPVLARGDGHMLYLMARSTALDFDWKFDNDLARFGDPWHEPMTATGRNSIVHPIGPALLWTPLIWLAQAAAAVVNLCGADIPLHGYALWHQKLVFFTSVLFACGAVLLGRKLSQLLVGGTWAPTYAAVAVLLGTPLTYYATYMPSYAHAMDAFACAAFLAYWSFTVGRCDIRRWLGLGALLGIATLIRVQDIALGIVVAVEVVFRIVDCARSHTPAWRFTARHWIGGATLSLAIALLVFSPQLLEWHLVFGNVFELPQGVRYTRLGNPMIAELIFSARNGWWVCTPIAYVACIGLLVWARKPSALRCGLVAGVAVQIYLNSTILDWWSSASFGQRRLCSMSFVLVIGLSVVLHRVAAVAALAVKSRRIPPWCWHGGACLMLGPLVAWNLARVVELGGGKSAPDSLVPTCCDRVAAPVKPVAQWLYDRVGNPFEFPANALFALAHGVGLSRWDQTVGTYPVQPRMADVRDDSRYYALRGTWNIGAPELEPYLVSGWSKSQSVATGKALRWTTATRAVVLVPNLLPDAQRVTLWLAAASASQVTVKWNGEAVAMATLGSSWTPVSFVLKSVAVGTHELAVESAVGTMAPRRDWPVAAGPVGVAATHVTIEVLPP